MGYVIYSGTAAEFQYWKFRTELKVATCKDDDDYRKIASNIAETLQGDPLQVAMDIGIPALTTRASKGIEKLIKQVQDRIFPLKEEEAKALYKEGHKVGGVVSRQHGESMASYITRRERWYKLLTSMDSALTFPDHMLADMLLDNAGLNETQKLLILTSVNNEKNFGKIAEALKKQHSKIQILGSRSSTSSGRDGYKGNRGGKGYGGGHRKWRPQANAAQAQADEDDWEYGFDGDESGTADHSHGQEDADEDCIDQYDGDVDQHDHQGEEIDDEILAIELSTLNDLEQGEDLTVEEDVAAELAQTETMSCMAWVAAIGKGKGKGRKGKGKGGGKRRFSTGRSNLSLDERKRKLKALKARTSCSACGEKGHWAGDPQCPKNKGAGAGKGSDSRPQGRKAYMATSGNDVDHGAFQDQYAESERAR